MTFVLASQLHIYLSWVNVIVKLLAIFAKVHLKLYQGATPVKTPAMGIPI